MNLENQPPSKRGFAKKWSKVKQKEGMQKSAPFIDLGYQVAGAFIVFVLGGYFLDKYFNTRPTLMMIGVALAILSMCVAIWNALRQSDRK